MPVQKHTCCAATERACYPEAGKRETKAHYARTHAHIIYACVRPWIYAYNAWRRCSDRKKKMTRSGVLISQANQIKARGRQATHTSLGGGYNAAILAHARHQNREKHKGRKAGSGEGGVWVGDHNNSQGRQARRKSTDKR